VEWLHIVGPILLIVVLALFAGWAEKNKQGPVAWVAMTLGILFALLWLKEWLGNALILVMVGLDALNHIPRWIDLTVVAAIAGYYIRFTISAFSQGLDGMALEQQKIKARIELMDGSINRKLEDIQSRLPEREEPEYLKKLREQAFRD
jgi:hypothetical protein